MPFEYDKIGSGITRRISRKITAPFGAEEQRELLDLLRAAARATSFEGRIEQAQAWARQVLESAGLPPDSTSWPRSYEPYGDSEWYAGEILERIGLARALLEQHESEQFGCIMYELGSLATEAAQKFKWERFAEHGLNNRRWLKEGHERAHGTDEEKGERWAEQVSAYSAFRATGMSKTKAMRKAAEQHGVSVKTIQRARKRFTTE